jgi:hypothetical protein
MITDLTRFMRSGNSAAPASNGKSAKSSGKIGEATAAHHRVGLECHSVFAGTSVRVQNQGFALGESLGEVSIGSW